MARKSNKKVTETVMVDNPPDPVEQIEPVVEVLEGNTAPIDPVIETPPEPVVEESPKSAVPVVEKGKKKPTLGNGIVRLRALSVGEHPVGQWRRIGEQFNYDTTGRTRLPMWAEEVK